MRVHAMKMLVLHDLPLNVHAIPFTIKKVL